MDYTASNIALQIRPSAPNQSVRAIRKVFASDPGLAIQLLLTIPIISGGMLLQLNVIQWVLVVFVTLLFLVAGIFRTAALLQINRDSTLSKFHVNRIKCMGNALVTISAGLSLITYLIVFVPCVLALL